jgi:opacity protein-like surface antigen
MRKTLTGILVFGLLFAPAAVMAADQPNNYVAVKLGMYNPGSKTLGVEDPPDDLKFKSGFDWEVVYGRKVMPYLALELGAGMFSTKSNTFLVDDGDGGTIPATAKVDVIPVTLNAKGIYSIDKLDLFALAGLGYYRAKFKFEEPGFSDSKTKSKMGFQLGVGADYNFTSNVFAGLEAKYLFVKPDFGEDSAGKVKLNGFQTTANIGYRF